MDNSTEKKSLLKNKKGNSNNLLVALVILLILFCGYLIWKNISLQKSVSTTKIAHNEVVDERDEVKFELEGMLAQYEEMEANNITLSEELAAEKEKIETLLKQVKGKNWTIYKLKQETETLRTIMKGYIVHIDSLNQVNGRLEKENRVVKTRLSSEKSKSEGLTKKNEDLEDLVMVASYLKTSNIASYGVKIKSNNTGRATDKAKRVGKIRTEFTLLKNAIALPGKKWIYVRILTPDGTVLSEKTDDSNKFDFNGVRGLYSSKKQIDYKNQELSLTIDWKKIADFPIGEYNVEIYADGVDIGKTKFFLK